jgi:alkaline phosphatase
MFRIALLITLCTSISVSAQRYTSSSIFAHNDYLHAIPFFNSYYQKVGFIEADVFLHNDELVVAHTPQEIDPQKTLENLYLKPLSGKVSQHGGYVYPDQQKLLTLMIDLKTEGDPTLKVLVQKIKQHPALTSSPTLRIAISGNVPDTSLWRNYPSFIWFDGRPGIQYSAKHLQRVAFISTDFKRYSEWNGKGLLVAADVSKLKSLRDAVHAQGKKLRFWGTPDFKNTWLTMIKLEIDIIGTDHVNELGDFINKIPKNTFVNEKPHEVYQPRNRFAKSSPKNIILMIGDGMGLAQLYSGYTANQGKLNIFNIPNTGFSITTSSDSYITDSAAGATAMASGSKTNNRHIGVDSLGRPLPSISSILSSKGFLTALISAGDVTDATPAAFYGHRVDRSENEAIALDFLTSGTDILIGGGSYAFIKRTDGNNLQSQLENKGYVFLNDFSKVDKISGNRFVVLDDAAVVSKQKGRSDFLNRALKKTLTTFNASQKPFFVMAEGAQIDHGGHSNDMEYVVREQLDFDRAVGEMLKFIDNNGETLLIITADHETGGLSLLDGNLSKGYIHGDFSTNDHTGIMVPVFAYGPGAENFSGVYQNTEIYQKIRKLLKLLP